MSMVISAPCLAAALMLAAACDGFHAGYVSAGGAPAATARDIDTTYATYAERDASVARAIRDDTEFRALGFVLRTQGAN